MSRIERPAPVDGSLPSRRSRRAAQLPLGPTWSTTVAAFVLAFIVGALLMIVSDTEVRSTFSYFFARPSDALIASWEKVSSAYGALIAGAIGGCGPITETTAQAAPLICAGLGVGLAFRAGLFNIGAQGQAIWGAILAAYVGFTWHLPPVLHLLVAILGGLIGGGDLGRHRRLAEGQDRRARGDRDDHDELHRRWSAGLPADHDGLPAARAGPTRSPRSSTGTPPSRGWRAASCTSASCSSLLAAVAVWWMLDRSTTGFAIRAVGANPHAAATAGMSVARTTVITMVLAGALAGLAGVQAALGPTASGVPVPLSAGIVGSIGFDAITVALLGRSKPLGTVLAGLLFGALHAGGLAMQSIAQTPLTLTTVLQALIVLFVAAPGPGHQDHALRQGSQRPDRVGPVPEGGLA